MEGIESMGSTHTERIAHNRALINITNELIEFGAVITLDGKPATLSGEYDRLATVTATDGTSAQFMWISARLIITKDGNFLS